VSYRPSSTDRSDAAFDPVLTDLVNRLVTAFQPDRIYFFGSKARGDDGSDSDYDLMVVVPDEASPERRRSRLAYRGLRGTGVAVDVLVWTRSAFDSRRHLRASLSSTVIAEETLVYFA